MVAGIIILLLQEKGISVMLVILFRIS